MPTPKSATIAESIVQSRWRRWRSPPTSFGGEACARVPSGRAHRPDEPGVVANAISWYDAAGYCNWLSKQAEVLPKQWCYPRTSSPVCKIEGTGTRGGTDIGYRRRRNGSTSAGRGRRRAARSAGRTHFSRGTPGHGLSSEDRTHPPGRLLPNEFGLFDTLGNVKEWCHDGLTGPTTENGPFQDPYPSGTPKSPPPMSSVTYPVCKTSSAGFTSAERRLRTLRSKARSAFRDEGPVEQRVAPLGLSRRSDLADGAEPDGCVAARSRFFCSIPNIFD